MLTTTLRVASSAAFAIIATLAVTGTADARCARLAFSVNDYGKDGPTKDAKSLLDKHVQSWTAARGISKYTVGKKDVSCELFLDFGFFDEHTCKASATVCWPDAADKAKVDPAKAAAVPAEVTAPRKTEPPKTLAPKPAAAPKAKQPADAPSAPAPTTTRPKAS